MRKMSVSLTMQFLSGLAIPLAVAVAMVSGASAVNADTILVDGDASLTYSHGGNLGGIGEVKLWFNGAKSGTVDSASIGQNSTNPPFITFAVLSPSGGANFSDGFATINATTMNDPSTFITHLTVTAPTGYVFDDLLWSTRDGSDISVLALNGATTIGSFSLPSINPNGEDRFFALALNGAAFTEIDISSTTGFSELKQFEISGFRAVPGPIVGAGLPGVILAALGMFGLNRRRRRA